MIEIEVSVYVMQMVIFANKSTRYEYGDKKILQFPFAGRFN